MYRLHTTPQAELSATSNLGHIGTFQKQRSMQSFRSQPVSCSTKTVWTADGRLGHSARHERFPSTKATFPAYLHLRECVVLIARTTG